MSIRFFFQKDPLNEMILFMFSGKMTYLGQKFCVVVYPMEEVKKNEESADEIEMKEQSVPLSAEDEETPKSADC